MDLELIIAKLHEELGLIDRAIADLERLPVRSLRRPGRPRNGRHVGPRTSETLKEQPQGEGRC
jgi:hypothetical protein